MGTDVRHDAGIGIELRIGAASAGLYVKDAKKLVEVLGETVAGGIGQLAFALDRVVTLREMVALSHAHLPPDSHSARRNLMHLVFLLASCAFEVDVLVKKLARGDFHAQLSPGALRHWESISDVCSRWSDKNDVKDLRNQIGHHFDRDAAVRGALDVDGEFALLVSDFSSQSSPRSEYGAAVVLAGLGLTLEELDSVHRQAIALTEFLFEHVRLLIWEILRAAGARLCDSTD